MVHPRLNCLNNIFSHIHLHHRKFQYHIPLILNYFVHPFLLNGNHYILYFQYLFDHFLVDFLRLKFY